jgi:DNA repair ATPase RecN
MNIFNKIIPWFMPTKEDQKKWYSQELSDNPRELNRLVREFSDISQEYNKKLGDFESELSKKYELYEFYLEIKGLAQKTNFIWNRIEYKNRREEELKELIKKLKD